MQIIPLQPVPNQTLTVNLNGQICQINVYTRAYGLYLDLFVNNAPIIAGVPCQNANFIVRSLYLGFIGDLCFLDQQGSSDPVYTGLGTQYVLCYLEATDLAGLIAAA